MSDSIHGHDLIDFMQEKQGAYTKQSLKDAAHERFGADARFHTCSTEDMTAEALINFLFTMGKFVENENGLIIQDKNVCNH